MSNQIMKLCVTWNIVVISDSTVRSNGNLQANGEETMSLTLKTWQLLRLDICFKYVLCVHCEIRKIEVYYDAGFFYRHDDAFILLKWITI